MSFSPEGMWKRAKIVPSPDGGILRQASPQEQEVAQELLQGKRAYERDISAFSKERQLPKGPEEIAFIGLAQMMIAEERKELGLEPGFHIVNEHMRFFDPQTWKHIHVGDSAEALWVDGLGGGRYFDRSDLATVRRSPELPKYAHLKTSLHEMRHQASFIKVEERPYRPRGQERFVFKQVGLYVYEDDTGRGLNEAVTEGETREYLKRYKDDVCEMLGIHPDEYEEHLNLSNERLSYYGYIKVAKSFAEQTDKVLYGDTPHTWDKLRKAYFTGELDVLDDIKSVVGKDAFRLLMAMGNLTVFDHERFVKEFFPGEDAGTAPKELIYEGFLWALSRYIQNTVIERVDDEPNPIEDLLAQEGGREKLLQILVACVRDTAAESLKKNMPPNVPPIA